MKLSALFLTLLLFYPGFIWAQEFDDWGELKVLGLGQVWSLEYSPDGSRLAVGGTGGVRYLDTDSYETDTQMHGAGAVRTVSWSPDGRRIVSIANQNSITGEVKIWDAETGELVRTHQEENLLSPWQAAWSPDGSKIAAAFIQRDGGGIVRIWDAETGQEFRTIRTGDAVSALGWSPDSRKIATGPAQATSYELRVWDVENGTLVRRLAGLSWSVASIRWSPDGTKVAAGSFDLTARIWEAETGRTLHVFRLQGSVISVAWSPDGSQLATGDGANLVKI